MILDHINKLDSTQSSKTISVDQRYCKCLNAKKVKNAKNIYSNGIFKNLKSDVSLFLNLPNEKRIRYFNMFAMCIKNFGVIAFIKTIQCMKVLSRLKM